MTIDEFVDEITRPLYVYRMAKANLLSDNPAMVKSAKTRMKKSKKQMQDLTIRYTMYIEDRDRDA